MKHGAWHKWYENGQKKVEGAYAFDQPKSHTDWTWWHPNGQMAAEGRYADGKKVGKWSWWYPNGLPQAEGYFVAGRPSREWIWWDANGQVARRADYSISQPKSAAVAPPERRLDETVGVPPIPADNGMVTDEMPTARVASPSGETVTR